MPEVVAFDDAEEELEVWGEGVQVVEGFAGGELFQDGDKLLIV